MAGRMRLDDLLVNRGLAESKSRAKALIMAGKVKVGTTVLDKAGKMVPEDLELTLESPPRFVSRGGEKLVAALDHFHIDPTGLTILDVGASTGGFTDCLLQRGAVQAVCLDVGRAQLHGKLLADPRVTNLEKINARHLTAEDLPQPDYPLIVMDLSFISLTRVLEAVWNCLQPTGTLIALVKPQFEAPKVEADRGRGIIRDPEVRRRCLERVLQFMTDTLPDSHLMGWIESPIHGGDGNLEYLAVWTRTPTAPAQ